MLNALISARKELEYRWISFRDPPPVSGHSTCLYYIMLEKVPERPKFSIIIRNIANRILETGFTIPRIYASSPDYFYYIITRFNDAPGRKKEEVLAILDDIISTLKEE